MHGKVISQSKELGIILDIKIFHFFGDLINDKFEFFRRDSFDAFLNDMVTILIFNQTNNIGT